MDRCLTLPGILGSHKTLRGLNRSLRAIALDTQAAICIPVKLNAPSAIVTSPLGADIHSEY